MEEWEKGCLLISCNGAAEGVVVEFIEHDNSHQFRGVCKEHFQEELVGEEFDRWESKYFRVKDSNKENYLKGETPSYYKGCTHKYEASKVVEDFQSDSYNIGTAITYLLRAGKKIYINESSLDSKKEDIKKAIHHLQFELERL